MSKSTLDKTLKTKRERNLHNQFNNPNGVTSRARINALHQTKSRTRSSYPRAGGARAPPAPAALLSSPGDRARRCTDPCKPFDVSLKGSFRLINAVILPVSRPKRRYLKRSSGDGPAESTEPEPPAAGRPAPYDNRAAAGAPAAL
ncbi:hypothetical protein EVAR_66074_1 [Eumeta japonica]|uniref:Uncharacterized protein n=1 Tax=Eumeta variegata TaxID=151549 RepID=A0A4C2A5J6_EUMVA|nr:hypothetical protein EVAR_66074_1 [Eumeta japonica]